MPCPELKEASPKPHDLGSRTTMVSISGSNLCATVYHRAVIHPATRTMHIRLLTIAIQRGWTVVNKCSGPLSMAVSTGGLLVSCYTVFFFTLSVQLSHPLHPQPIR